MNPTGGPSDTYRHHALMGAALALVLTVALVGSYSRALGGPFQYDDTSQVVENPLIRNAFADGRHFLAVLLPRADHRRPLPDLTFALNFLCCGPAPRSFHFVNLGLHLLNALLLFSLARKIAGLFPEAEQCFLPLALGVAAWALQPFHTQAVSYIVQRSTLMAAGFSLASLRLWIAAGEKSGWRRPALYLAAGAAAACAILSKESAAGLPLLILLWEYFSPRASRRRLAALTAAAVAMYIAGISLLVRLTSGEVAGYSQRYGHLGERLLSQARVIWHYLSLIAWPAPGRLSVEHPAVFPGGLWSPPSTALAWAGLVVLLTGGVWLAVKKRPAGFALLFFFIALLPESGWWPIQLEAEHRLYLPSSLLLAGAGATAAQAGPWRRARLALVCAVLLLLGLLTGSRNRVWESPVALWRDAVAKAPQTSFLWQNLSDACLQEGRVAKNLAAVRRAHALNPDSYFTHLSHAAIFLYLNRLDLFRAMRLGGESCVAARAAGSTDVETVLARAECAAENGQVQSALDQEWNAALAAPPGQFLLWFLAYNLTTTGHSPEALHLIEVNRPAQSEVTHLLQLAQVQLLSGHQPEATDLYRQVLQQRPDQVEALVGLGQALTRSDPREAVKHFRRAREVEPALGLAADGLCEALAAAADPDAGRACATANLLDPLLAPAWKNLGRERLGRKNFAGAGDCFAHARRLTPEDPELAGLLRAARDGAAAP